MASYDPPADVVALLERARPVADPAEEIDETRDILDDEEWDYAWSLGMVPIAMILARDPFDRDIVMAGETLDEQRERLARVRAWMTERGGAGPALQESPVLVVADASGIGLLDGWHRIVEALADGQTEVYAGIGLSTTPVALCRAYLPTPHDETTSGPGL